MIDSAKNPFIQHLILLRDDGKYRKECSKVLIEGESLIKELLPYLKGGKYLTVEGEKAPEGFEKIQISKSVGEKLALTNLKNFHFVEVDLPVKKDFFGMKRILAFDGVSDPGNLGTLMRTALAFNFDGCFLLPGSVDPFHSKVIRASKGASFILPLAFGTIEDLFALREKNNLELLAADLHGEMAEKLSPDRFILTLGNEGVGLTEALKRESTLITLPISSKMESLNVAAAGAILMYLFRGGRG